MIDYWVHLQILVFCLVIGTGISLFLGARSYIKIALVVLLIYIPIEIYYSYKLSKALVPVVATLPVLEIPPVLLNKAISLTADKILSNNSEYGQTITADGSLITLPSSSNIPIHSTMSNLGAIPDYHLRKTEEGQGFATEKSLEDSKYYIFQHPSKSNVTNTSINKTNKSSNNESNSVDKPPFDGLDPKELLSRLNYIYYATAQPAKRINYHDFKTHADTLLDGDGTKLSNNDPKLQSYAAGYYPQLTADQIDARDCLNYGSESGSCFQSPQLFYNAKHNFNILDKGVNTENANLITREDFSMPSNLEAIVSQPLPLNVADRKMQVLFMNAPKGILDVPLDQESNESIGRKLDTSTSICRNCKLAVCKDDYCSLQNSLFM
jgi:hypothetical protein